MVHEYSEPWIFLWKKKTFDPLRVSSADPAAFSWSYSRRLPWIRRGRDIPVGIQRAVNAAPFFICANFLQNIGVIRYLKSGTFPFLMSVLSGYPMGAKIVGDLRRSGEISVREAKRLMSFCSTSGPAFLIGAVGTGMLGSGFIGGIIAASHYLGAAVNGMVYTAVLGKEGNSSGNIRLAGDMGVQDSLTNAMLSAFKSLGIILAYIVLFTFATDMLHLCGAFS